jgi:hypothetical protein
VLHVFTSLFGDDNQPLLFIFPVQLLLPLTTFMNFLLTTRAQR